MKKEQRNIKLIVRFTLNFIIHQILLGLAISLPAIIHILVFKSQAVYVDLTAWIIILVYFIYCLFYGYYVARPLYQITDKIQQLAGGTYLPNGHKKQRHSLNGRLYREIDADLETLSATLKENEQRRKEFEKQRQEWAAGITHDLKTPLSYITGYANMLLSDRHTWDDDEKKAFLELIREKAVHMEELINDLGIVFQMDQPNGIRILSQKVALTELIRQVVADVANMPLSQDNRFEIFGAEEPIYVSGDHGLLKRAFSNLLVNAVIHNPRGTAITVHLQRNSLVEIQIIDNGQGMDAADVSHLFDRYYRGTATNVAAGGTGLGMAIVKQIVTAHQGSINVKSEVGSGTTVIVRLPLCEKTMEFV